MQSNSGSQFGVQFQPQQQQFQPQFPQTVQTQPVNPGMYPANYFPYIAVNPDDAFKKKPGFSEEQKLASSKVSKTSKLTSKSKKDKKKKRKDSSSES